MDPSYNPYAPPESALKTQANDRLAPYLENLQYPLKLTFRVLTFSPRFDVVDATGKSVIHVRKKLFKFREHVEIFSDDTRKVKLADIRANKIIDWSARYNFTDAWGGEIGSLGRKGWRSMWKAYYEGFNPGDNVPDFVIREENPLAKVMDALLGEIPFLGLLTAWLFHPRYLAARGDQAGLMRLTKQPAFWEGKFSMEALTELEPRETMNLILSFLMLTMLEKRRG